MDSSQGAALRPASSTGPPRKPPGSGPSLPTPRPASGAAPSSYDRDIGESTPNSAAIKSKELADAHLPDVPSLPIPPPSIAPSRFARTMANKIERLGIEVTSEIIPKLEKLGFQGTTRQLEASVQLVTELADALKVRFSEIEDENLAAKWAEAASALEDHSKTSRAVIGIAGNTGAGKSSLLNAVLDERRVLPTNGVRACTAVATEIMWNESDDPAQRYRAEIEFISADEWERELEMVCDDVIDAYLDGSTEQMISSSEAGDGLAKIREVHPSFALTKETVGRYTAKELAAQLIQAPDVQNLLGTKLEVGVSSAENLYSVLQKYLDSQEKPAFVKRDLRKMAYWPLIRVVRIFLKSEVLSNGTVLVDLPGVQDANAARCAIADRYLVQCSALWIVSPITRAVDDKAAKTLLGKSFKLQLKMDGSISNVSFICTKTDDISLEEIAETLGGIDKLHQFIDKETRLARELQEAKDEIPHAREWDRDVRRQAKELSNEIRSWETFASRFETKQLVRLPEALKLKRKRRSQQQSSQKMPRRCGPTDSDDAYESSQDDSDYDEETYMDAEMAHTELAKVRSQGEDASERALQAKRDLEHVFNSVARLETELKATSTEKHAYFINKRNDYARTSIQSDFAAGILELDIETRVGHSSSAHGMEAESRDAPVARDYDEVARSLQVFCVSSRGYQQLRGRAEVDRKVKGYRALKETGITQLQDHAKDATLRDRRLKLIQSLNELGGFIASIGLWMNSDAADPDLYLGLSKQKREQELQLVKDKLESLQNVLENEAKTMWSHMRRIFDSHVFNDFDEIIATALQRAATVAHNWSLPAPGGLGLRFSTYRAICKRDGMPHKSRKARNFNEDLWGPFNEIIAEGWSSAFEALPDIVDDFVRKASENINNFVDDVTSRPQLQKCGMACVTLLTQKAQSNARAIQDATQEMREKITVVQREATRGTIAFVKKGMEPAYAGCKAERGRGAYVRMKSIMDSHMAKLSTDMYQDGAAHLKTHVVNLIRQLYHVMWRHARRTSNSIAGDVGPAIVGFDHAPLTRVVHGHIREIFWALDEELAAILIDSTTEEPGNHGGIPPPPLSPMTVVGS